MATCPKIDDNEMNYYQFKAKQIMQLEKEDQEWKDFCKQSASECAACLTESENVKDNKDIGIQVFPRKFVNNTDQTSLQPRYQDKQAEALNHIKTRLEKIDLTLSNLVDVSHETEKDKKPAIEQKRCIPIPSYYRGSPNSVKEQRKSFIRTSLQSSLLRLQHSIAPRKPSAIKNPNICSKFEFEVLRAADRKAYLASLQTKPKVSFQKEKQSSVKTSQPAESRNIPTRNKLRLKILKKRKVNEEVITEVSATAKAKDPNIENVLEALLDDILKEITLDIHNITEQKRKRYFAEQNRNVDVKKENGTLIPLESLPSVQNIDSKITTKNAGKGLSVSLDSFFQSSIVAQQGEVDLRKEHIVDKSTSTHPYDLKPLCDEPDLEKTSPGLIQMKSELKTPKFVCDISHIITVDPEKAEEISYNRDKYLGYLESISRICKGNFNPWRLNKMLAESVLDGCIHDVAEELIENFTQRLYNQEFSQRVES